MSIEIQPCAPNIDNILDLSSNIVKEKEIPST